MADETLTKEQVDTMIAKAVEDATVGLKKSQRELLAEKKALEARFDGIDPDEAKALKQRLEESERRQKAEAAGITSEQLTKLRAEALTEFEKQHGPRLKRADELESENRTLKLDTVVKGLMGKGGARAERIDALFRLTSDRFDLTQDGKPMLKDAAKEVDKYIVEDLRGEYPEFFQGSGSSGGGAAKSNGGAGGAVTRIAAPVNGVFGPDFLANVGNFASGKAVIDG